MANITRTATTIKLSDMLTSATTEFNIRTTGLSSAILEDNIVDHYLDFMFDGCYFVTFSNEEKSIYDRDPKRLAHVKWGCTDLFFVIMIMNEFVHPEDMDLWNMNGIYIPSEARMAFLTNAIARKLDDNLTIMDYDDEEA